MRRFDTIVESGLILKKTGILVFVILIFVSQLFLLSAGTGNSNKTDHTVFIELRSSAEIRNTVNHYFLSIELTNSPRSVSEVYRMSSLDLFFNKVKSFNSVFGSEMFVLDVVHFINTVPIFIKGHALLN